MLCVILVAGHGTRLEAEIKTSPSYKSLSGIPKALLPSPTGGTILDAWWSAVQTRQLFSDVLLITNAAKYKYFERWATASNFPIQNLINDGTTTQNFSLGGCADLQLGLKTYNNRNNYESVLIVSGDMLFEESKLDMTGVIQYFHKVGDLAVYYELTNVEEIANRGIVEIDETTSKILAFYEKPKSNEITNSKFASVVFYCLKLQAIEKLKTFNTLHYNEAVNLGLFISWLVKDNYPIYGYKLPTAFHLIGSNVSLSEYESSIAYFSDLTHKEAKSFTKRAYARIGLVGNPSDGFNGKTISLSIKNFWADVTFTESKRLVLSPHPLNDPVEFGSLCDLSMISKREGYLGGLRLVQATCKMFYEYCINKGIALGKRNFTVKYDTNIPRQVGLAGSSAIVTATLKCLLAFYELKESDMPIVLQPQFVLNVEIQELFIQAGLQDRVIQIFEGLVYMDFCKELVNKQGYGNYERLQVIDKLPTFFLVYIRDPSDSGIIHSDVKARWKSGDKTIIEAMKTFAQLTDNAREAIMNNDWDTLKNLMNANFNLRREIYSDQVIGEDNLKMVEIARSFDAAAKLPGSGGAVIGLCMNNENKEKLKTTYQSFGYVYVDIIPNNGGLNHDPPSK